VNIPNAGMKASNDKKLRAAFNKYMFGQGVDVGGFKQRNSGAMLDALKKSPELMAQLTKYRTGGLNSGAAENELKDIVRFMTEGDRGYALYSRNQTRANAAAQQKTLQQNQLSAADDFRRNLPTYVQQEAGALKKSLSSQLAEARGTIKANENARGMLYSGRRQKSEGEAANRAQSAYTQGVGDIASGAEKAAQSMAVNPLKSAANLSEAQSQYSQGVQQARDRATQGLMSNQAGYMGLIGQAAGSYLGGQAGKLTQQPGQQVVSGGSYKNYGGLA